MASATMTVEKVVRPGRIPSRTRAAKIDVFCKIEFDGTRLSITGVEGPLSNGDANGGCGQIDGGYAHRDPGDDDQRYGALVRPEDFDFAEGWNPEIWLDFLAVWKRWHMNDAVAWCEHQKALGWDKLPIDPAKPTTAYGRHFDGQKQDSWNLLGWVRPDEHPDGLLTKPCPECGYRYGTAWLHEDVPPEVIEFLAGLPDADRDPVWV